MKEIIAQGDVIDKFICACVMAVFKGNYHLDRAVDASLAIRDHFNNLPEENQFSQNIGSATLKRLDYTII